MVHVWSYLMDGCFSQQALKGTLGFPLIRFEDAVINMYPFTRVHPYETQEIIINDILKHFREVRGHLLLSHTAWNVLLSLYCVIAFHLQELMSQAAQILGSVDFLGNPMGLLNDVTEGVSELIKYGNVGGLIRNVTHGVSNSAAKVRLCAARIHVHTGWNAWILSDLWGVVNISAFSLSSQERYQMGLVKPWTTGTRVSGSTLDTTAPLVESTWWQGFMDSLMVDLSNISVPLDR